MFRGSLHCSHWQGCQHLPCPILSDVKGLLYAIVPGRGGGHFTLHTGVNKCHLWGIIDPAQLMLQLAYLSFGRRSPQPMGDLLVISKCDFKRKRFGMVSCHLYIKILCRDTVLPSSVCIAQLLNLTCVNHLMVQCK